MKEFVSNLARINAIFCDKQNVLDELYLHKVSTRAELYQYLLLLKEDDSVDANNEQSILDFIDGLSENTIKSSGTQFLNEFEDFFRYCDAVVGNPFLAQQSQVCTQLRINNYEVFSLFNDFCSFLNAPNNNFLLQEVLLFPFL